MDRLDTMRLYARIVELGSFTAAANDLDLPRATVTNAIKQLEARLGAQLLQRTTRCQRVTRDGQAYYAHCVRLLADLDEVESGFRDAALKPQGRLREVLPGLPPPALPVHVLYASQRQLPARLRVFVDWLVELMERQQ